MKEDKAEHLRDKSMQHSTVNGAPRSWIGFLWRTLRSVKVGVSLLALLALAAVAGTVIESKWDTATAQKFVYHSVWFSVLMAATVINLIAATWNTTLLTLTLPWSRPIVTDPKSFKSMSDAREIKTSQGVDAVGQSMQRHIGNTTESGNGIFAQSGIIQRWGAIISHIGVVLLLGGGVFLTVWFYMAGPPGGAILWVGEGMERDWYLTPSRENPGTSEPTDMPFRVRLHDFDADHFPNTQIPRAYTSTVELFTPDGASSMHSVNMNEALRWRGYKLSQSSFIMLDDSMDQRMGEYFRNVDRGAFVDLYREGRPAVRIVNTDTGEMFPVFDAGVGLRVPIPQSPLMFETPDGETFRLVSGDTVIASGPLEGANHDVQSGDHNHTWGVRIETLFPNYRRRPDGHETDGDQMENPAVVWTLLSDGTPMGSDLAFFADDFRGMSFASLPVAVVFEGYEPADLETWSPGDEIAIRLSVTPPDAEVGVETPLLAVGESWTLPTEEDSQEATTQPDEMIIEETPRVGPYRATLAGRMTAAYTGLSVTKESDSLKYFFYLSFLLFLLGPFVSFATSHVRVWAWVDADSKRVWIGGNARGRRAKLKHVLDQIEADLGEENR